MELVLSMTQRDPGADPPGRGSRAGQGRCRSGRSPQLPTWWNLADRPRRGVADRLKKCNMRSYSGLNDVPGG